MTSLFQDLKYALRSLRRSPGFTSVALVTLALGIGANTAMFTLVDRVLLALLPVSNPSELVLLRSPGPSQGHTWSDDDDATSFSYPMYRDLRDRNTALAGLAGVFPFRASVEAQARTEQARAELVSGNYFDVLGVAPAFGRVLVPSDDLLLGGHPVAVLSFGYFVRRFGANPAVLNKSISVNGHALTVVGVARAGFQGVQRGRPADIFVPLMMKASMTPSWNGLDDPKDYWLQLIGRLKPHESLRQAVASLQVTYRSLLVGLLPRITNWDAARRQRFIERPIQLLPGAHGRTVLQSDVRAPLLTLMGMVGAVLLIACANLAGLLLARGAARRREHGIRMAIGANRAALIRQTLVESLVLAFGGGVLGIAVASWWLHALLGALPSGASLRQIPTGIDPQVLMFTLAISVLAGVLFGLAPAWRASRLDPSRALRGARGAAAGDVLRFRRWLVSGQVALTLTLLVGAALFARSLHNLSTVDLGLKPEHILQFSISPRLIGDTPERTAQLARQLTESLSALPGVRSVSAAELGPFQGDDNGADLSIEGIQMPPDAKNHVLRNWVGPDYFATLGIPLVGGREFNWQDHDAAQRVAVVNETLVRRFFPGSNPVGQRIGFGGPGKPQDIVIAGVVRDSKSEVDGQTQPFVYQPYLQDPTIQRLTFYLQTQSAPAAAGRAVRSAVERLDPQLPILEIETLRSQIADSVSRSRLVGILAMAFAGLAALLACVGIYGVLAFSVAQRTQEIGVRMAVGADAGLIRRLILGDVVRFLLIGGAVGLPIAYLASRLIASLLFGVRAADAPAFVAGTAIVVAAALAAGYFPARRAARIDPMQALRAE
jgi:putative ABC transport system permease protein